MTQPQGIGPDAREPHGSRRTGAVARLRLTRRFVDALEPLDRATIEADVENPPLPAGALTPRLLRTDLMIRALDLRIRVALLPGRSAEQLDDPEVLRAAQTLLFDNPETASIAVVADDEPLTCQLIEPFDAPKALVPSAAAALLEGRRRGPAAPLLRDYLRQVNPGWSQPPRATGSSLNLPEVARTSATASLRQLQSRRKNVPEWKTARATIGQEDADWAAQTVTDFLEGQADDLIDRVRSRSRRFKP
jgi:hypothetical protein